MYTCLCREDGGIIDDIFIFMISDNEYFLVVNAGTKNKDYDWFKNHIKGDVLIEDITDDTAKIDIQGPAAKEILERVFKSDFISGIDRFLFLILQIFYNTRLMISNTGYTGEAGYELYIDKSEAVPLWRALLLSGKDYGILHADWLPVIP